MQRLVASPKLTSAFRIHFLNISDQRGTENIGKLDAVNVFLGIRHALQCLRYLLFRRPDVVYVGISQGIWGYLRDLTFVLPAACLRRRIVLHLRGSEFRTFYQSMPAPLRLLTRFILKRTSRVIVLGNSLKRIFQGLAKPDRVIAIPNGISPLPYSNVRGTHIPQKSGKRILYLSHLSKRKGIFLFLDALLLVYRRHRDVHVTVAGLWQHPADKSRADTMLAESPRRRNIEFVGEVVGDEKTKLFQSHDVFVFPPVEPEGLPWVILEAMSAGLPVITTDQGAISEVVEDGKSGFIVPPMPGDVADRICYLIEHPQDARKLGQHGKDRVTKHFSEETYLTNLVTVLQEVACPQDRLLRVAAMRTDSSVPASLL